MEVIENCLYYMIYTGQQVFGSRTWSSKVKQEEDLANLLICYVLVATHGHKLCFFGLNVTLMLIFIFHSIVILSCDPYIFSIKVCLSRSNARTRYLVM